MISILERSIWLQWSCTFPVSLPELLQGARCADRCTCKAFAAQPGGLGWVRPQWEICAGACVHGSPCRRPGLCQHCTSVWGSTCLSVLPSTHLSFCRCQACLSPAPAHFPLCFQTSLEMNLWCFSLWWNLFPGGIELT